MIYLYVDETEKNIIAESKHVPLKISVFKADYSISEDLKWSYNGRYVGFFNYVSLEWVKKEWALNILDTRFFTVKTIFIGDDHTSNFAWMDNDTIRVCARAGTGVRRCRNIDVAVKQPIVAVDDYSSGAWIPLRNVSE